MQKSQTKKKATRSPNARTHSRPKARGTGKDGSPKTGTPDYGGKGLRLHLLENELTTKPLFEVALLAGWRNNPGLANTLGTEALQLTAIEDLYSIMRSQPRYKNLKDPVWSVDTLPVKVLGWILRKLGPLAKGDEWTIDTYGSGKKTRFRFVIYRYFSSYLLKERDEHLSIDFLPFLLKRDPLLHDLIIDAIALVSRYNNIPLWDHDGDYSEVIKSFVEGTAGRTWSKVLGRQSNGLLETQRDSYKNGLAASYLKLLRERKARVTPALLRKRLSKYRTKSYRQRDVCNWISYAIRLAKEDRGLSGFTFVPNHLDGNPITPFRLYKFIWSNHEHDYVRVQTEARLESDNKKTGIIVPVCFSVANPRQILQPIKDDRFPVQLYQFMEYGVKLFHWRWRDYFYKKMREEQQTPTEIFLARMEQDEIKNMKHEQRTNK